MPSRSLTPKQAAFVQQYLVDLNATAAARRAGYSEKTAGKIGFQLLEKTRIQEAIQTAISKAEKRTEITVDYVLSGFKEVVERCLQHEPVLDQNGNETGIWKFNALGANKALEMLGKHLNMFTGNKDNGAEKMDEIMRRMGTLADHVYSPKQRRNLDDFE